MTDVPDANPSNLIRIMPAQGSQRRRDQPVPDRRAPSRVAVVASGSPVALSPYSLGALSSHAARRPPGDGSRPSADEADSVSDNGHDHRHDHETHTHDQSTKDTVLVPEELRPKVPKAMSVAASDSGAGAGIQGDLKTFAAHGVYGTTAIVAITAQSTKGVYAIAEVPDEVVVAQIDMMMEDIGADAAKTGMLSSALIVEVVADRLAAWGLPTVVDPVMISKSGDQLLQRNAVNAVRRHLIPISMIVTPNIPEAEVLSGRTIITEDDLREAARAIHALGTEWVLIKGGHRAATATDVLFDGVEFLELPSGRVDSLNTHGTGCTLSAAITANLALGMAIVPAVESAKSYLTGAIRAGYAIGGGHSPVNHFYRFPEMGPSAVQGTARMDEFTDPPTEQPEMVQAEIDQ